MADEQVVEPTQEQVAADSSAGFARGFNTARGVPPPVETPVEKPVVTEEVKAEPVEEVKPDEWEGVPPKVKAELESVSARLASFDKLPDRLRNIEGHIGGITSQLKTALAAKVAVEKSGAEAPTSDQIAQAKSSEKWAQLKVDYPDWAEAMDERLATLKPAQATVDVAGIKSELAKDFDTRLSEAEMRARQFARVDLKYEDWEQTINSPAYLAWIAKQPPEIRALEHSPNAKDAIQVLDAYSAAQKAAQVAAAAAAKKKAEKEAQDQRLKGASTPQGAVAASPHTLDDADALDRGFARVRGG